jgi:hypothetical protein
MCANPHDDDTFFLYSTQYSTVKSGWSPFWSADWSRGADEYVNAADAFQRCPSSNKAARAYKLIAFRGAAACHEKSKSYYFAAQYYEKEALLSAKIIGEGKEALSDPKLSVLELSIAEVKTSLEKAKTFYLMSNNPEKAANALRKAGKEVGETDARSALGLYELSLKLFLSEGKEGMSEKTFNEAIGFAVRQKAFDKALCWIELQQECHLKDLTTFQRDSHRNVLSALIINMHLEEYKEAFAMYERMGSDSPGFITSQFAELAEAMWAALRIGSQEMLTDAICAPGSVVKLLLNPIARLGKKLQLNGEYDAPQANITEGQEVVLNFSDLEGSDNDPEEDGEEIDDEDEFR